MSTYTKEWNVKWEQLAPALQQRLNDIQDSIISTESSDYIGSVDSELNNINYNSSRFYQIYKGLSDDLKKKIKNLNNKISNTVVSLDEALEQVEKDEMNNAVEELESALSQYYEGQIVKVMDGSFIGSDNLYEVKVVDNDIDKDQMMSNATPRAQALSTFDKFSHFDIATACKLDSRNNIRDQGFFVDSSSQRIDADTIKGYCQNDKVFSPGDKFGITYKVDLGDGLKPHMISEVMLYDSEESRNGWSYDSSTECIKCNYKGISSSGIVYTSGYEDVLDGSMNCDIDVTIDSMNGYGNFGIVIGYLHDKNEELGLDEEHTLSLIRANGITKHVWSTRDSVDTDTLIWHTSTSTTDSVFWGLVYDFGYKDQVILTDNINTKVKAEELEAAKSADLDAAHAPIVHLRLQKRENVINGFTSRFSDDGSDDTMNTDWNFEFVFPKKIPVGWTPNIYNNIKRMLDSPRLGFIARANKTKFYIKSQHHIIDCDDIIVSLHENKVYQYKNGQWVNAGPLKDFLIPRTFLYNDSTKRLYFYYDENYYRRIG